MSKDIFERKNEFGIQLKRFLDFNNISINEFAERIGTTPKNLIDIFDGKISISQNMIYNISFVTEISTSYIENVEKSFQIDKTIYHYLLNNNITIRQFINRFHYQELKDKYHVIYQDEKNDYSIAEGILKYLRSVNPETITKENNQFFYKSKNDKPELLALWLEHCYRTVKNQDLKEYKKENIDKLVDFIKKEARNCTFDKERLKQIFNQNGIFLAIEPDLDGSKIRGAFRVLNNKPAIYITPKYKRCADIYFSLLHELAHCKSDFNRAKSGSIVSYENSIETDDFEMRADRTAFNWMVNDKDYQSIIQSKNYDDNNEVKCFLVYRLAHDKFIPYQSNIYQKYNHIII